MNKGIFDLKKCDEENWRFQTLMHQQSAIFEEILNEPLRLEKIINYWKAEYQFFAWNDDLNLKEIYNLGISAWTYHFFLTRKAVKFKRPNDILDSIQFVYNILERFEQEGRCYEHEEVDIKLTVYLDFMLAGVFVLQTENEKFIDNMYDVKPWEHLRKIIEESDLAKRIRQYHA